MDAASGKQRGNGERFLFSKQMYFSTKNYKEIALKYIGLRTSAMWRFQTVNICLKMAK
jgi:hypothetical protein